MKEKVIKALEKIKLKEYFEYTLNAIACIDKTIKKWPENTLEASFSK